MRRSLTKWVPLALAVAAVSGCDDEDGGTGPLPPAAIEAVSPVTQTGTAGAAAAVAPSVRVTDADGRPVAGVDVTFTVTAGSGLMGSGSRTTDPSGVATAGGWVLGSRAGVNEVTAKAPGLPAVVFTATSAPGAAAVLARAGGDNQTALVGEVAADSLAVRVADAFGNPLPGVVVAFAVTEGTGSLSPSAVATGADGVGKVRLTLGRQAGQTTVTANAAGLPEVAFTLRAVAGPATRMVTHAGDDQEGVGGQAVPVAPAVRVTDTFGNPLAGIPVRFTVSGGGGRVAGANATTGADGVAAVGSWTLQAGGANTLVASSAGLPSVTFTATAVDPCGLSAAYAFGTAQGGELDATDCRLPGGQRIDFLDLKLDSARSFTIDMKSGHDAFLYLFNSAGRAVAANDDGGGGTDARIHVIAPAGQYFIGASSSGTSTAGPVLSGSYTVTTGAGVEVTGCTQAWIVPGATTQQALTNADTCYFNQYADRFMVELKAGQTVTVTMTAPAFESYMALYGPGGSWLTSASNWSGTPSRIQYTAPSAGRYTIEAASWYYRTTGSYTLSVQ